LAHKATKLIPYLAKGPTVEIIVLVLSTTALNYSTLLESAIKIGNFSSAGSIAAKLVLIASNLD